VKATTSKGDTALHYACKHSRDPTTLAMLLRYGSDAKAKNRDRLTPLHIVALR